MRISLTSIRSGMPTAADRHRAHLPPEARLTPQRRAVLAAIEEVGGSFTVAEVYERARRYEPRLGLATAYRTLELLRRTGSVRSLPGTAEPSYLLCHPGHHHHLVCLACGGIEDTDLCAAPDARELRRLHGFEPQAHELEIYGTCRNCSERGRPATP